MRPRMPFPGRAPHRDVPWDRAPHGSPRRFSGRVARGKRERAPSAERGRRVACVLATVSDGVSDVATAVCIRHATPPLAKERARVLRCRRARSGRAASARSDRRVTLAVAREATAKRRALEMLGARPLRASRAPGLDGGCRVNSSGAVPRSAVGDDPPIMAGLSPRVPLETRIRRVLSRSVPSQIVAPD